jgi:drug/metabolite transporter (DMT)-like permease
VKISKNVAYVMMAVAAVMWSTSGTFTELALDEQAAVMQITVFTYVFSALILAPAIMVFDRKSIKIDRGDFVPFFIFSLITGTFFAVAWYACVDLTGVATAVILLYAYPSIVTIASVFFLKEKMTPQKAIALPLTFIGAVLVAGAQEFEEGLTFNVLGVALGIYTAIAGAVYYIWGKKFLDKYSANTVILYMTVLSIPVLVVIGLPFDLASSQISTLGWVWIFLSGLIPGTIGFVVSMMALNHLEASKASIVASIEPVAAVAIAYLVLSQTINVLQGVGVALVFFGVILLRLSSKEAAEAVVIDR